jgi:hypothetical protein
VQVAALIDEALRKMGGVCSSKYQQDDVSLGVDTAAGAAAGPGWNNNAEYSSADAGGGSSTCSSSSSDEEVEVAGGLQW